MDIHAIITTHISFYTCPNCSGTGYDKYATKYRQKKFKTIHGGKNNEHYRVITITDSKIDRHPPYTGSISIPYCECCEGTGELTEIQNHDDYDEENM